MTIEVTRKQTPVLLLTGYLGSGKTTLVNRILSNADGIKFAVIVNDIGEVNIDADLIQRGGLVGTTDDSLVPLQNGCICCSLKMDLVSQLSEICSSGRFDYIVIEASGICEPAPIAQTICSMPSLVPSHAQDNLPKLDCIVTIVDALRMQSEFDCGDALGKEGQEDEDLASLVIEQIEFCNTVLLNKASEVSSSELEKVRRIIKALNPKVEILDCDFADVDLGKLLCTDAFDFDKVATSAAWIDAIEGDGEDIDEDHADKDLCGGQPDEKHKAHKHEGHQGDGHPEEGRHHHHHHHHDGGDDGHGITTHVYFRRQALDINKFDWMVARRWPRNIIRAKGLCYFSDETSKCYLFEQAGVQKSIKEAGLWFATMPEDELAEMMRRDSKLRKDWDPIHGDRMVKLVFIGQDIDSDLIDEMMDECLDSSSEAGR